MARAGVTGAGQNHAVKRLSSHRPGAVTGRTRKRTALPYFFSSSFFLASPDMPLMPDMPDIPPMPC